MRRIKSLVATATNSARVGAACILALMLVAPALLPSPSPDETGGPDPAQAIIAYSFLRYDYLGFNKLLASSASLPIIQNLRSLDAALKSLHCDVPTRMAPPHKALLLPSTPVGQWVSFPKPSKGSLGRWLFVMPRPAGNLQRGVLVILSTEGPRQTTVFWVKEVNQNYQVKLAFDSYEKGKIRNESTTMGAVTSIKFESDNAILLKDWGEPGIGPPEFTRVRRVFRLNLSTEVVTEVSSGTLGRR